MNLILLISDLPGFKKMMVSLAGNGETVFERISANQLIYPSCDLVIVEFTRQMLNEERYKLIFDLKSRLKSPVLAVLEEGNTREKLNILNFGADDYLERENMEKDCCLKIKQLLRQKRITELMKEKNILNP